MDEHSPDPAEPTVPEDAERFDGPDIVEYAQSQRLGPPARLELLIATCDLVEERFHAGGETHRLLRPGAVHVDAEEARPVLTGERPDAESGPAVEQLLSDVSRLTDTVPYLAPELIDGGLGSGDARGDVYALAVIGFEMLTGRTPRALGPVTIDDVTRIVPEETAARLGAIDRRFRGLLDSIFDAAIDRDPARRPASAGAFARELREALERGALPGVRGARPQPGGWGRRAILLGASAVVLVVATAVMFWSVAQVRQARYDTQRARTARAEADAERDRARSGAEQAERKTAAAQAARAAADRDRVAERQRRALAEAARTAAESMRDVAFVSGTVWGLTGAPGETGTLPPSAPGGGAFRANAGAAIVPGELETLVEAERERRAELEERLQVTERTTEEARAEVRSLRDRAARAEHRAAQAQTDLRAQRRETEAAAEAMRRERARVEELSRELNVLRREVAAVEDPRSRAAAESRAAVVAALDEFLVAGLLRGATARAPYGRTTRTSLDEAAGQLVGAFPRDPLVEAIIALRLARSYLRIGLPDAARPLVQRAVAVRREVLGASHADVGAAMDVLVDVDVEAGVLAKAEATARELLDLRRRTLGDEHHDVATSMERLAEVQRARGALERAGRMLEEAISLRRQFDGDEHPATLDVVETLAALWAEQGRYDEAEQLYVMTLDIRRRVHDAEDPRLRDTLAQLAGFLLSRGRYEEAGDLYAELVATQQRAMPPRHWRIADAMSGLGAAFAYQDRFDEAEPLLLEAFAILWETDDAPESSRRVAIERAAVLYARMGDGAQAARWSALLP
ncbi:MAG: tetratricopeptide repeat protein [Planctomycetes bacterium]|nr:tetratricopeptide repeat protein [Planctomycetota bacterium]